MANIATNECLFIFDENSTFEHREECMEYIDEHLIYEKFMDYDITRNTIELSYGTKWNERAETLQEIADKFNVNIVGVCYEWGCVYVNAFNIKPNILENGQN